MKRLNLAAVAAAAALLSAGAHAGPNSISGSAAGLNWTAQTTIVGVTSTATAAGGGDSRYFAAMPQYNGVVSLIMEYAGGAFICSGTLLADRRSILTAAHCVSDGAGSANPLQTTAYFYGGPNPDTVVPRNPVSTAIGISNYYVNAGYTGEVIDHNDIAILRLADLAPSWANSYELYTPTDLVGTQLNVAGYGGRSDGGGAVGTNLGTGRLRQGQNRYDFRWGDAAFGGFFTDRDANGENFFGTADYEYSYLADFDNGRAANDASCALAVDGLGLNPTAQFCNLGVGADEAAVAGGDSGGPEFVNGRIASVTSYGLSFGSSFGDIDNRLNSTFGEFSGYVPVYYHADWINANLAPEPGSLALAGLALLAAANVRRRRAQ